MNIRMMKNKSPKIYMTEFAHQKLETYIAECNDEIGALATVEQTNKGVYLIKDAFLFKQEVHATTCEITTEGLTEFANEILALENGVEIWNEIKCWFHSHVNMGVSPSGQDEKQMELFENSGHDFFIRLIGNKKGEMGITLYDYSQGIIWDNLDYNIIYDDTKADKVIELKEKIEELNAELNLLINEKLIDVNYIKQEMKEKVSKKTFGIQYGGYGNYGSGQGVYYGDWWKKDTKKNETNTTNQERREKDRYSVYTNGFIKACKTKDLALMEAYVIGDEIIEMASLKPTAICDVIDELFGDDITLGEAQTIKDACIAYSNASFYDIY